MGCQSSTLEPQKMKVSLIFLLIALYGAVAEDADSSVSSEDAAASSSTSSDMGAKFTAAMDNVADLVHSAVVNGSSKFNASLDSALTMGSQAAQMAGQFQQQLVANVTSAAQGFVDKGIEQMTQMQEKLQSSQFGALLSQAINMKIQAMKMAQQGMGVLGKMEAAKGALLEKGAVVGADAARGAASGALNAATAGSTAANAASKQVSGQIGSAISAFGNMGARLTSALPVSASAGAGVSGLASSNLFTSFLG